MVRAGQCVFAKGYIFVMATKCLVCRSTETFNKYKLIFSTPEGKFENQVSEVSC